MELPSEVLTRYAQAVRQTVRIIDMDHPQGVLRTGDRATVQFEFISHPEFVKEGMKLLFREGKTKVRGFFLSFISMQHSFSDMLLTGPWGNYAYTITFNHGR